LNAEGKKGDPKRSILQTRVFQSIKPRMIRIGGEGRWWGRPNENGGFAWTADKKIAEEETAHGSRDYQICRKMVHTTRTPQEADCKKAGKT